MTAIKSKDTGRLLLPVLAFLFFWLPIVGSAQPITLTAQEDVASFAGFANTSLMPVSRWDHSAVKFDLNSVSNPVTSATLRVHFQNNDDIELTVWKLTNDSWSEAGGVFTEEAFVGEALSVMNAPGAGYVEFDVSEYVQAEALSDGVASFEFTTSLGGWRYLSSRESANPPQLVVLSGTQEPAELEFDSHFTFAFRIAGW